jgi:undecaprenyl-diphosphatase
MQEMIQGIDEQILFLLQNLKNPVLDRVMVFVTSLGNSGLIWIMIAFLLLLQKRYQKCGVSLLLLSLLDRLFHLPENKSLTSS